MKQEIPESLQTIIDALHAANGRCLLAGGGVIDHTLGLSIKDWDIEVYNLSYQQLSEILEQFGSPNLVGKSFGVIKLRVQNTEFDFSIPRKDNRIGKGHRAFTVDLLPDLSPQEAARRRDLTINSLYLDLHTGEILDFFGGISDLQEGRLKATDPETFIEDPLRVLRIMQLLPRKGKFVDPATIELCRSMINDFGTLPAERLFEEFKKLFLKADTPSLGLQFLADCGWLSKFPELAALQNCPQHPEYHPEGNVWTHTLLVMDQAARLRPALPADWRLAYMFGMLLHDIGKPVTTDLKTFTAYGHEKAGLPLAKQFMERISNESELIDRTLRIVETHMRPSALHKAESSAGAWRRLHNRVPLHILAYVTYADSKGRTGTKGAQEVPEFATCMAFSEELGKDVIKPVLLGRHLIERGLQPGPQFTSLLDSAFEYQLDTGCTDIDTLFHHAQNKKAGVQ